MKSRKIYDLVLYCVAGFFCLTMTNLVFAGAVDLATPGGKSMKLEYQGDNLRINTGKRGAT